MLSREEDTPPRPNLRATNSHLRAAQVRRRAAVIKNGESPPTPVTPQPPAERFDEDSELGYTIEDGGPGKNILSRHRTLRSETGTHESLTLVDADKDDTGGGSGFDPYNTGQFDRSKNWTRHTRK
ncbi:MAG: hypothetical protein AAGA44_16595 [Pseudomonadota bacterium]